MDIVYPLCPSPRYNDIELRMSLRSIEKYLLKFDKVFIVGHLPNWCQNVEHLPAKDTHTVPDRNVHDKILVACNHPEVSDDFLFFNDDHYLLSFFEATGFPYFYYNSLESYVRNRSNDQYGRRVRNSLNFLKEKNLPVKFFDIHTPIIYNKKKYIEIMTMPWDKVHDGFVLKSIYANSTNQSGTEYKDQKTNKPPVGKISILSSYPHMKHSLLRFLMEQYPEQSKFEKTGIAGF